MSKKILVTDDDRLNIALMRDMLGSRSYRFLEAHNGLECLDIALKELPDLIILDWQMPHMDGIEALRHLKSNPETEQIPVLMVTGIMNSSENLMHAMDEGAVDFLRKPFDRLELRARVRNMLLLADSIKELKKNYEEIESSNQMIEALFAGVPDPLVLYRCDGTVIRYNEPFGQLCDQVDALVSGDLVYKLFAPEYLGEHMQHDFVLAESGNGASYEAKFRDPERSYIFSKRLIRDIPGQGSGIVCLMKDITSLKNAHNDMMEGKKRELVSSTLRLIQITEMNNNLMARISGLRPFLNKNGLEFMSQILREYSSKSNESVWQDFEARFENVYEHFYRQLQARFPDLTPGEKKLCALLRLNISSKDIAAITLQNPQSIDTARYRLRKKLNLKPEDNLVEFLLRID